MNKEEKKVPELRFKGFYDDWEQRKLDSMVSFHNEKRIPIDANSRKNGKYPYYGASGIIDYVDDYIFEGEYVLLAEDGANILTRNSPIAYLTKGRFWVNNHAHIMKSKQGSNTFLVELLEKQNFSKYNSGTAQPKLNTKTVKNIDLFSPSPEEQMLIGRLLKKINLLITLHQQKIRVFDNLRNHYVRKMFPKENLNYPELHFKNYQRKWSKSNFGSLLKEFVNKSQKENEYDILSSTNSGMEKRSGRVSGKSNKGYKIIEKGDIVLSPQNLWLGNININNLEKGLVSPSYKTFKVNEVDSKFLKPQLRKQRMLDKYKKASTQGASVVRRNLDMEQFYQIVIKVPEIEEKSEIGSFFDQLESYLAHHQLKLDKLQQLKELYLRKMFL